MLQNLPFPSLKAYAELAWAFQRILWPQASKFFSSQESSARQSFKFATGLSQKTPLSVAVVDCITQVQQKLGYGVHPNFCQLLVTVDPYGNHVSLAPSYVQEIFGSYGFSSPTLIGGAVSDLIADFPTQSPRRSDLAILQPSKGISLMAASLPGVSLHPFRVDSSSLPDLSWADLMQNSSRTAATFLLSEPHFQQASEFTERLQNILPEMPIIGGTVRSNAWGQANQKEQSMRGALFLNSDTYDSGAVGCILQGDLEVDALCIQGCRPVGPRFHVTRVEEIQDNNVIMELDSKPAYSSLVAAQKHFVGAMDQLLQLQIGIDKTGQGNGFKQMSPSLAFHGGINVGSEAVPEGSLVQLHVKDSGWAQYNFWKQLEGWLEDLPSDCQQDASQDLGMLLYSCSAVNHHEQAAIAQIKDKLKHLEFQGCKVEGEFTYAPGSANSSKKPSALHTSPTNSFCSSFGILRQGVKS